MGSAPNWLAYSVYNSQGSPLHQADKAHMVPGSPGDPGAYAYGAPAVDAAATEALGYVAEGEDWLYALDTPGLVIDSTPRAHEAGTTDLAAQPDDATMAAAMNAAHADDQGASRERNHVQGAAPMQFADEAYIVKRFDGLPATSYVDPITTRRGLNGLPENNPDGFPLGSTEQVWVDRKFAAVVARNSHDVRMVTPNTAYAPVNQPVPGAAMGASNSPFDSLARGMLTVNQRPQMRREQPGITEALLTDDEVYPASTDWVAG